MTSVLVIDDEEGVREAIGATLKSHYEVATVGSAEDGLAILRKRAFDIVISDIRLPGMDGLTFLERVLGDDPSTTAIAITGYASVETAIRAIRRGVWDYIAKPFSPAELRKVVERAVEMRQLHRENEVWRNVAGGLAMFLGESAPMRRLLASADQVAKTDAPAFVKGETGSGKEYLARYIHAKSGRSARPLIAVNCSTFSESLMGSEVFGHTKGAFTGAIADRRGCIELADKGTLLLDEIAELKPELQARLLRVIEERSFCRLGSERRINVDVRYLATVQQPPDDLIRAGKLREDLYFRLGVVTLEVPPLRDRVDDLPGLVGHFLRVFGEELKKPLGQMGPEPLAALRRYAWPGNVRELRNVIERVAIFARPGEPIGLQHLPSHVRDAKGGAEPFIVEGGDLPSMQDLEQRYVKHVLAACGGVHAKAAKVLGVSASTLWRWEQRDEPPKPE